VSRIDDLHRLGNPEPDLPRRPHGRDVRGADPG
jgi:hypothetical protein